MHFLWRLWESIWHLCVWKLSSGEFDVRFIAAKSRVAPLKRLTIPRLEREEAVLASSLYKTILEESRFQFTQTVFFLDHRIVLARICSEEKRFKPFVSIWIGEIQNNSDPAQWRHIPGELNVADDVSRGITVQSLAGRWQREPDFLRRPEGEWPQDLSSPDITDVEKKRSVFTSSTSNLGPYRDPEGVYRVGGRVDRALFFYETRHQSLLPREHWVSRPIVRHVHQCGHRGIEATVAKTRKKYWVFGAHFERSTLHDD